MAIAVKTGLVPWWFTPEQEESDRVTRFKLKPLNGSEQLDIAQELGTGRLSTAQKLAIRYGLLDWENLDDANGEPIEFSKENINLLDGNLLAILSEAVLKHSQMDEEEVKNS